MKIVIASDTHSYEENLRKVIERETPFDMLIHLGDAEGREQKIIGMLNPKTAFHIVKGNNDFYGDLPMNKEISLGRYSVLLCHGHSYGVNYTTEHLLDEAKSRGSNMAMFGHTHKPYYAETDGIILLNPGSISYPRTQDRKPSYMVMILGEDTEARVELRYV